MKSEPAGRFSLSILVVAVMVSACGGGGGGSQNPVIISPTPTKPQSPINSAPSPTVIGATRNFNPNDPSNAYTAHAQGITGRGVTVGIIDTDFDVANPEFGGRLSKTVYSVGGATGNLHGNTVAEALGGISHGVAPGVSMHGAASSIAGSDGVMLSTQIYQDLFAKGVRIFNQSEGIGFINAPGAEAVIYQTIYQQFVAQGGLFIWAAGNESNAHPTLTAGLPALYPELQKGWLAVVAVNAAAGMTGDAKPGVLSSYSNHCGEAADWCLAAPGDFVSPSVGHRIYGSSFSAPAVTAAVALVQQVYPWMSADLLRQTILSTASDMHDRATYGWGLLDAGKAVRGPALFDKRLALSDNVYVKFDGVSATFGNDIAGDAGLIKDGSGQLILAGANTYAGVSKVVNGILNVTGSLSSGVIIDTTGTLTSDGGRIGSSVLNNGRLNSSGRGLTINGNYIASTNAVLANQLNTTLTIGGQAMLNSSHLLATTPSGDSDPSGYVAQQVGIKSKILSASGGVLGTFSDINFAHDGIVFNPGTFLNATLSYSPTDVDLTITRNNVATIANRVFATDITRISSAANIEHALQAADNMVASGNTGGSNATFLASAAALQRTTDLTVAAQVLDSLSGQIHASAQALSFQQSQAMNRDLSNRLASLGDTSINRTGLWVSAIGASGKLSASGYAGALTSLWGGQFGADMHLNSQAIIGAAIAYSDSQANFDRFGGQSKSKNTVVSLYGRYALSNDGAYLSARTGVASISSLVKRTAIVGTEIENLSAKHTDNMLSVYAETGYVTKWSDAILMPFVGLTYDRLKRGGFNENDGAFGLTATSRFYHQNAGVLGVRGSADVNWRGGHSQVQAHGAWQHGFSDGKLDFSTAFVGAADAGFTVRGITLPRNSGWAGVGLSTTVRRYWGWYANYDTQFGYGGLANNVFSAGIRFSL